MYTFVTSSKIVVSNLVELNDSTITVYSVKAGHDIMIGGEEKEIKRLYQIITSAITKGGTVINFLDIKEQFCFLDLKGI